MAATPSPGSVSRAESALFLLTLAILMVPYATLLIPLYVLLNGLGLQNSLIGLSFVLAMFQLPFATFMMRISFEAVPRELEESALVDGCGTFGVLWRILLPSVRPGLITVGLFAFLAAWSDFIAPLILLSDSAKQTLPLAMATLRQQTMGAIVEISLQVKRSTHGLRRSKTMLHLSECDLRFLVETVATNRRDYEHIVNLIRDKDDLLEPMLDDPKLTERLFRDEEALVRVTPHILFSVLLRRLRTELEKEAYVLDVEGSRPSMLNINSKI